MTGVVRTPVLPEAISVSPFSARSRRSANGRSRAGLKRLAFADCLETLEEIGVENAGYFREAGGERFVASPCLNDSAKGMAVIDTVSRREFMGWTG